MIKLNTRDVVDTFKLTNEQAACALERGRDVAVTAGAGSGKTRTLVARYASLLADGLTPRQVLAITFTEKAAREMRSRLRGALEDLAKAAGSREEKEFWAGLNSQMDSARISTIHALCSEILRSHPAEAGIDPRFEVFDEALTSLLKTQVVQDTLVQMATQKEYHPLFQGLETTGVEELLTNLLKSRLEAGEVMARESGNDASMLDYIAKGMSLPIFINAINELKSYSEKNLITDAGPALASQIKELLTLWDKAEASLKQGDMITCASLLFRIRREKLKLTGKKSSAKDTLKELQEAYDEILNPLIRGKASGDTPPSPEAEILFNTLIPLIRKGNELLNYLYRTELDRLHALDFDDLEYGAVQLLQREDIRAIWRGEIQALLVDEFQDTNPRQREIVQALAGEGGKLFVVGDAKQSIYRFRRADVTVFQDVLDQTKRNNGLVKNLDLTYRAHEPLLESTGDLLAAVMGERQDPTRPFSIPFEPLRADRKIPPEHISGPHIEFIFGAGDDADEARPVVAHALANRLLDLKRENQIHKWDDVALLFRASTGYAYYEDAFEDAGIPFVTVAGRGFYDRPEVRDVLNVLSALADPADDLAMAGLLRSPAFGLSDPALYQLRFMSGHEISFWTALQGDLSGLDVQDQQKALRALQILKDLVPRADHEPVAELLKAFVDAVDYRAILAMDNRRGSSGRLWRNLDKLIMDAQDSGQVNVRDFLEYMSTLKDSDAREGEAPSDAQGAVRLMTIHKSKGLEFPVVVLADASRRPVNRGQSLYLLPETGLAIKLDPSPMAYRFAKLIDDDQEVAERGRVLYVALTRAKDKLIINGHLTIKKSARTEGWMSELSTSLNMDLQHFADHPGEISTYKTVSNHQVQASCFLSEGALPSPVQTDVENNTEELIEIPLFQSLVIQDAPPVLDDADEKVKRIWRATDSILHVPPEVIGTITHKALELWLSVDDIRLIPLLEALSLDAGLATQEQRIEAVRRVRGLIERFCDHPLKGEIDSADERHHEVPYSLINEHRTESGYIDLLYRKADAWHIVDFKTDSIHSSIEQDKLVDLYALQMFRYAKAVHMLLGQVPQLNICFLDSEGKIRVMGI
jgi:ATP-dependent helicase/nuclease subunit A